MSGTLTLFCIACGKPSLWIEALSYGKAPIIGKLSDDGNVLEIDWGDGYLVTPDTMPDFTLSCVECGEPVNQGTENDIVVSDSLQAPMWKHHPSWTPHGWLPDTDKLGNYFDIGG